MNSTRTITLLKCKVVVTNVPDDVDEKIDKPMTSVVGNGVEC